MKLFNKFIKKLNSFRSYKQNNFPLDYLINILLIVFQVIYIQLRFSYLNQQIPFWFTKLWGDYELASKEYIYIIPIVSCSIFVVGLLLNFLLRKHFIRYLREVTNIFVTVTVSLLTVSCINIIFSASIPFPPLVNPLYLSLAIPFVVGYFAAYFALPRFISYAKDHDLVTNPQLHQHPGMILSKPSARGGGFVFAILFVVLAMVFVGFSHELYGVYIAVFMLGLLGLADDFQNTNQKSKLKALEHPFLRLLLLFCAVSVIILSGVVIRYVGNPLGGIFPLDSFRINIAGSMVPFIAVVFTLLWVVWVLNLLSWSNGIDGQYGGIVGIASLFICLLALRFVPMTPLQTQLAILAALSAGIAFGFTKYTWFPSKIMWGFGATSAGLVIASLSILINTKVLVSVLILLIPFLDAVVTFVRRILQGKNPLKGDRGHLHHLLMERGWSVPKIAVFYWVATFVCGLIGVFSSERYLIQVVMTVGGIVAFFIILVNLKSLKKQ